jgi:hypothetical protein
VSAEQFKKTQRKLVKTLSNFSPKKSDGNFSRVMSFLDVKKDSKAIKTQSDDERDEKTTKSDNLRKSLDSSGQSDSDSEEDGQLEAMPANQSMSSKSLSPLLRALVDLVVIIFEFKEQHIWLKENAAVKLLHRFTGTTSAAERYSLIIVQS